MCLFNFFSFIFTLVKETGKGSIHFFYLIVKTFLEVQEWFYLCFLFVCFQKSESMRQWDMHSDFF